MDNMPQDPETKPTTLPKYQIKRSAYQSAGETKELKSKSKQRNEIMQILTSWPNYDVWPFKVAIPAMGFAAAIPGLVFNRAFRGALLLGHYGKMSSAAAVAGLPAITAALVHYTIITSDILEEKTKCPVCVQVRSASIQLVCGLVYPAILTPIVNFGIATGLKNLYFPKVTKEPKVVIQYGVEIFRSIRTRMLGLAMFQVVAAMGMTYLQQECYFYTLMPVLRGENDFSKETRKVEIYS